MVIRTSLTGANVVSEDEGVPGKAACLCSLDCITGKFRDNFGEDILHSILNNSELSCFSIW